MESLKIDLKEVARYLGYGHAPLEEETLKDVRWAVEELQKVATPRVTHQVFPLEGNVLGGTTLSLEGQQIQTLLTHSHHVILLAVTLGQGVDGLIGRLQVEHLARSVIADVCASSMVEGLCHGYNQQLEEQWSAQGGYLTPRFSPGYGDFPLTVQGELCSLLDTQRKIGLTATSTHILTPRKSITAVIGIQDMACTTVKTGCAQCTLANHCSYQKEECPHE